MVCWDISSNHDITIAVIVNESFENKRTFDKTGTIDYMK
jgi:hypothetical protein